MTNLAIKHSVIPSDQDAELARKSSHQLSGFTNRSLNIRLPETREMVKLPASAARLLVDLLAQMAEGNTVTLVPTPAQLTTQQAADLLGVSRPFFIRLLDDKQIPYHKVGTHRRVLVGDLMDYKQQIDAKRHHTLDELAAQAQALDMGY